MTLRTRWLIDKEEVVAKNGAVAATRPAQADAGLEVLKDGGSAVDAAVAIGFLVSVMEPMETCTGGCGFMLVYDPKDGKTHSIEFGPRAPAAARPDMYEIAGDTNAESLTVYAVKDAANSDGYLAPGIPSTVAGLIEAHRRFGRLPLSRVLEPAIAHAEAGVEVDYYYTHSVAAYLAPLLKFPRMVETFLPGGAVPAPELPTRLPQRALAETLRQIARDGGESFYRGEIAESIVSEVREGGGILSRDDLAGYRPDTGVALSRPYRDVEVHAPGAPGGHWTELQILQLMNQFDLRSSGHNTPETLHSLIEVSRLAFQDRYYHLADPDFEPVPLQGLLSESYASELAGLVDPATARAYDDDPQEPWGRYAFRAEHDPWRHDPAGRAPKVFREGADVATGGTTHFCAVDADRMLVSCTHTAAHNFGAKFLTTTGVHIHAGMNWFTAMPGAANSIAGGKRPLCNMGPVLITKLGKPYMALGAPGGRRIIECVVQILSNVVDHGMSMQAACSAPRLDASSRTTYYDDRLDPAVAERLESMGHRMEGIFEDAVGYEFAHPTSILVGDDGYVRCGVDPFRKMWAAGL